MRTFGFDLILQALDVSLDRRKIALAIGGLFVTALVSSVFFYMAVQVESVLLAAVFMLLGGMGAWVLSTLVQGAVAKMSYDDLSRRPVQGWEAALGFSSRHLLTLFFSPLVLALSIGLILLGEVIVLFLGRIPYVGELWASLLFLPLVLVNVFLILLGSLGMWLIPAVVASEGSGVMDTLRRVQGVVRVAPGRILVYFSIAVILGLLTALVIVPLVYSATAYTTWLTTAALGREKMIRFAVALPDLFLSRMLPGELRELGPLLYEYGIGKVPFTYKIGALIFTLANLLIPVAILAVLGVVFPVSCACATFISVREEAERFGLAAESPAAPERNLCASCGAEVSPKQHFCTHCGAPQNVR